MPPGSTLREMNTVSRKDAKHAKDRAMLKSEYMKARAPILVLILAVAVTAFAQPSSYVSEINKWRGDHEKELRAEDGWLTVAGLYWLKEGVNTVGAGNYDVVLTDNFKQGKLGTIDLIKGKT